MFTQLHEKRGNVLIDLYKKLINLDSLVYHLTIPFKIGVDFKKEEEERRLTTFEAFNDFSSFYNQNRIYFAKKTCHLLDQLRDDIKNHINDYTEKDLLKSWGAEGPELTDAYKKAAKVWEKVRDEIPLSLRALEDEFRRILGVPYEEDNS